MESIDPFGFSSIAIDHAQSPRNMDPQSVFDGHASVTGSCGDSMDFWIRVENDMIVQASFATDGCGSSKACGSMATVLVTSRPLVMATILRPRDVLGAFNGFPEDSEHCAELAVDALHACCQDYFRSLPLRRIARKLLVVSGKGGVGKSTVAVHLARQLHTAGSRTGILDADIHGPSVPSLLEMAPAVAGTSGGRLLAADVEGLKVVSMAMLAPDPDKAIVLRGPRKTILVRQFLREVDWGELDALVIDTPAGTGDELLTLVKSAGVVEGAVVVTTPRPTSIAGARRTVAFCREMGVPVLGILENMTTSACPNCGHAMGESGAGRTLADDLDVPFLGSVPLDPALACGLLNPSLPARNALDAALQRLVPQTPGVIRN